MSEAQREEDELIESILAGAIGAVVTVHTPGTV